MIIEEIMEAEEKERARIVKFLRAVRELSTHGASSLTDRAIKAIEANEMDDPAGVATPRQGGGECP